MNQYVSQIEDGLRRSASRSVSAEKGANAELTAKVLKFGLSGRQVDQESQEYADDGPARFERLLALVEGDEEQFGWHDVQENPDALSGLRPGHLLAFAGELYEADASKISNPGGILSMLPLARAIGKLPGQKAPAEFEAALGGGTLEAIESFGAAMEGRSIIQGDILDTDYRFVSLLPAAAPQEGDAYIVGKVSKIWKAGEWRMLPGLPIISQLTREQRREAERKGPGDNTMMWMEGPAVQLELLAIYR
ncbi:hypothetical protein [Microbacterium sp. B19]|uniref:DUF6414 family protein n=1 Tax=Microbacterium sp. B19 TaxID=96765 RepID=UPI0011D2400C|nr:hypothetical protein [Microbacterium sp. B19]